MFDAMKVFITIVDCGSLSAAATVLDKAPSSVSRQLDRLEHTLGVTLLTRSTRGLGLTEAGEHFYSESRKILAQTDALQHALAHHEEVIHGRVRISVFESFGRRHIVPLLPRFLQQHPQVEIEIDLDNQLVDLHHTQVDIAIRIGRASDSALKMRKLLDSETFVCASPAYIERHGAPQHPQDLQSHNCLLLNRARQLTWWHFQRAGQTHKVKVEGNLRSIGGEPLLEAARQGLGITLLPQWMIQDDVAQGRLQHLLMPWSARLDEHANAQVYAVFQDDRYRRPAVRACLDFFLDNIQKK